MSIRDTVDQPISSCNVPNSFVMIGIRKKVGGTGRKMEMERPTVNGFIPETSSVDRSLDGFCFTYGGTEVHALIVPTRSDPFSPSLIGLGCPSFPKEQRLVR